MTVLLLVGLAILLLATFGLLAHAAGVDSRDGWSDGPDDDTVHGSI